MAESELKISLQNILRERQRKSSSKHNEVERLSQIRKESLDKLDQIYKKFSSLSRDDRAIICGGESYACLESIPEKRAQLSMSFDRAIQELTTLETRFKRSTVNLVVIGAMGAGKSKFLQSASGLTDECIPSYSKGSCTGVTSIIENSDTETEAVFTFKTLREVTEEMDREIRYFATRLHAEDKMIPVSSISDGVRNLNTLKGVLNQSNQKIVDITGMEQEVTDADRKDIENLLEIYDTHKSVWMPYLADGKMGGLDPDLSVQETDGIRKCVLKQKSKIEEYVSKHDKNSTKKYYKYVAIKKAVIRTKFGSIDANIQLIDTVGIGDPAVDTEKRMMEAIQDEADGVIFILEGTDRHENHVMPKDQTLIDKFQEIYTSYRNRAGGEQKETRYWMAFLVNNRPKDGADDDYGQGYLDSAIIPSFNGRGKVFGEGGIELKRAINVGSSAEVGEMLSDFLKQISNHLKEIDAGLEKAAEKAAGDAIAQNRKVMDGLGGVHINSISNSLRNSMNLLREERMNALIEELCNYADQTIHRETDDNTSTSFLHQSLEKIRSLQKGDVLPGFTFGPKKDVSLEELIDHYYTSSAGYPKDPDSARIAVLQTLQSVIREIGSRPLENQKNVESTFKGKIADLFVATLHLDCLKLGDGVLEALNTNDPHFFSKISQKLLTGLNNTEDIQKAFQSLDQFKLDSSNGITKALFNYFSAKYLTDTLYEEANIYREKGATKKDLLRQELGEKLDQFIDAVNERTNHEAYMVAENEQMYGELVNFINVLGRKYEAAWKDVFDSMVERKLLLDVTEKRERLENIAAIAEEIEAQLKEYLTAAAHVTKIIG